MNCLFKIFLISFWWGFTVAHLKLSIYPVGQNVIYNENENLNLTCKVSSASGSEIRYNLTWILPINERDNPQRIKVHQSHNELTVTVHNLQVNDTGQYVCEVHDGALIRRHRIGILVNTGKENCMHPFFDCGGALCIPMHYVCDGYPDCPGGTDESLKNCGPDPCKGKFLCEGRCILKKLCCDPSIDRNCSVGYLMPCCQRILNSVLPINILKMEDPSSPVQYKYHNIGFYQSTVYTMISCAIAFIFMSTIMLIAVCHIRMRQASWFLHSSRPNQRHSFWRAAFSLDDRRINAVNQEGVAASASISRHPDHLDPLENLVLLTYDGNTGFELAEYGPKPPPYTESSTGIPPPPYSSMISIASQSAEEANSENSLVEMVVTNSVTLDPSSPRSCEQGHICDTNEQ